MSNDFFDIDTATTNLLDNEPELLLGCTQSEFFGGLLVSYLVWVILMLLLTATFATTFAIKFILPLVIALIPMMPTFYILSKTIAKTKRGKPNGYYDLELKLLLDQFRSAYGLKTKFVHHTGTWNKSRSRSGI